MELKKDIRVIIKAQTKVGEFCDALYYETDKVPDDTEIEKQAQTRIDNWEETVKNPPEPVEPTKEELEKMIAELEEQKIRIDEQIVEYQAKITALTAK